MAFISGRMIEAQIAGGDTSVVLLIEDYRALTPAWRGVGWSAPSSDMRR